MLQRRCFAQLLLLSRSSLASGLFRLAPLLLPLRMRISSRALTRSVACTSTRMRAIGTRYVLDALANLADTLKMGDDEDDFLNETVEFGDGTQYKIDADAHPPQSATQDYLREPDPSNFATREAPLAPGESHSEQHSREERFKDDYDRTWSKRASGDAKNLFNDRLGKLEPYASSRSTPGAILGRGLPPVDTSHRHDDSRSALSPRADAPPHLDRGPPLTSDRRRRESNSSQRSDQGRIEPPRAWGQNQARADHGFGSGAAARRPSIEQAGQGRQLPPHLSGIVSPRLSSRDLPRTVSHASPPMQHAQLPSISAVIAPVVAATPVPASAAPGAEVAPTPPVVAPVVIDLEELHVREMHAAAERAKIRRQEEEEGRMAQVERAKKKAAEIEERIRLAAEAAAPKVSAATTKVAAPTSAGPPPNSWRKALPATTPAVAPTPVLVPAAKSEPVRILARNNGPVPALPAVRAPSAPVAPPHQNPSSILAQAINSTRPTPPHLLARPAPPPAAKVVDDREWRRDPVVEPRSREPPPHLGAAEPQAAPRAERVRTESVPPSRAAVVADPAPLRAVPTSAKGVPLPAPLLRPIPITPKPVFKPRELSQLDDLMSRIKGVMNTPKPTVADAPETVLISQSASPVSHATVRLPGAIVAPVVVPGAFVLLPANLLPPPVSDVKLGKGRGRQTEPRKPVRAPVVEKRDIPMLFHTGMERSASPPPAWKAFIVRLASYPKAAPPSIRQVKAFSNPATPLRVNVQSPFRKLMREDPMHPRKLNRGRPVVAVATPKHTLARRTQDQEAAFVFAALSERKLEPELTARRGKGRVPAAETERLAFELAQGTTVSSSADLFDVGPSHSPLARSRLPSTANTPPPLINGRGDSPRKFMVTGGLNGEEVVKLVLRNLAAPGAPAVPALPVVRLCLAVALADWVQPSSTAPIFESSSSTSPSATSTWSATAPMSHSLLDPMTPSVWSAPPADAPVHARSISLGGVQIGNSLEGIADDDPSATIPQSLAELKSEDEGSVSGKVKDDARLRAAAPAFSTFSDSATGSGSPDRPPQSRYPFRQPQPQPHQYQLLSSSPYPQGYPSSYGQMPQYSPYATHQQLPSSYSPAMQAYSQGAFSLSPQQQQGSPFNPYRPNVVQNSGFGMSYGAIGAGTSFGAVGGGAHGNIGRNAYPTRSPVMAPYMTGGYMNGFGPPAGFQGRDPSFGSPQSEGPPRHVGNGYISSSSPVMMPQHLRHPSFHPLAQSQSPASNPSSFEASPQGMGVIGRGGPPAPLPAASGPAPSPQVIQRPE